MPVYLRKFYLKKIIKIKNDERKQMEASQKKSKVNRPSITPKFKR